VAVRGEFCTDLAGGGRGCFPRWFKAVIRVDLQLGNGGVRFWVKNGGTVHFRSRELFGEEEEAAILRNKKPIKLFLCIFEFLLCIFFW